MSLINCQHSDAVAALKKAGDNIEMIVMREILQPSDHHDGTNLIKEGEKFSAIVQRDEKHGGQFGFSLAGGNQSNHGNDNLYISKVNHQDQRQQQHSPIAVGDRLLAINGHETGNITHDQAIEMIANGGNNVELLLYREKYTNGNTNSVHVKNIDNTIDVRRICLEMTIDYELFLGSSSSKRKWTNGIEYCWRNRSSLSTIWHGTTRCICIEGKRKKREILR